ncbi:hypothetical protein [Marinobacter mobilis]|uniref:HEPN domain-containing protein n=1 Tax=Marinobacter mobilis TaxID=488533 RepID=A0A1H2Y5G1_9GAMM|nr:hypothetical protein [Marinobacter mobilis]SDX00356.1 hypothetical protein SAMN04487960_105269 [Marinobacter mobilis]
MEALDNLVKIRKLKPEPADTSEFAGMLRAARTKLKDAGIEGLSEESRFSLAYGAAHALSLAALRWHGYRSESRYIVFQCLQHTLGLANAKWRVLDKCHSARNLAEYEGHLEVNPQLLRELVAISHELEELVAALPPIKPSGQ